jgi:linearmycin/streptolysin S transport system ATP-binding protein
MIEVERLRRVYGSVVAVDGLSFDARKGEIFGLLGPNGAGKTTTIGCISGLLEPTSGRVAVMGCDMTADGRQARRHLGVVPQEIALYGDLSATENLEYWGGAQNLRGRLLKERVREALEVTGLEDRAKEPAARFSGGMKRRLNFACGIVHRPAVLLLDEPTAGVDPQSRVRLLDIIRELARNGSCVLYTTHYMEEAEALCDRIAIMDRGRMVAQGTLTELRAMLGARDLVRFTGVFPAAEVREAMEREGVEILHLEENALALEMADASSRLPAIFAALAAARAESRGVTISRPSLENLFIKLTGKELRE